MDFNSVQFEAFIQAQLEKQKDRTRMARTKKRKLEGPAAAM